MLQGMMLVKAGRRGGEEARRLGSLEAGRLGSEGVGQDGIGRTYLSARSSFLKMDLRYSFRSVISFCATSNI